MKLAFSTLGCPDYTIDEIIAAAVDYGYQAVSIRTVRGEPSLPDLEEFQPKGIQDTARKFRAAGLEVLCVSSGVRFTSPDSSEREKQLRIAQQYIDMAVTLGAPFIRVFGGPITHEMDNAATMEHIAEGFRATGEIAADRGVVALLETHDTFSTGRRSKELLDRVSHPNVALVWDILHSLRFGESFEETWNQVGPYVRNVHIKDSAQFSAEAFDIKMCGQGNVPIAKALTVLKNAGYTGYYEFEWEKGWHREVEEASVAFPAYVKYMRKLADEVGI